MPTTSPPSPTSTYFQTSTQAPTSSLSTTTLTTTTTTKPAIVTSASPTSVGPAIGDSFDSATINTSKWIEKNFNLGSTTQGDGQLKLSVSGGQSDSKAQLFTQCQWVGDFDVQVDFVAGTGWTDPIVSSSPNAHLDLATLGIFVDNSHWIFINRTANAGAHEIMVYSSFPEQGVLARIVSSKTTGKFRIVRNGTAVTFKLDRGVGWTDIYTILNLDMPVLIYVYSGSTETTHAFITYFDNFIVNSCANEAIPFTSTPLFPAKTSINSQGSTPELPPVQLGEGGFVIDGKPFRFVGANSPNFGFYPDYGLSIEDAIASASQSGIKVMRIYLWFGNRPWAGVLEDMDLVLDSAARNGVYVIPVLTEGCRTGLGETMEDYFRIVPHVNMNSESSLESFKIHINNILTRKNTVNGRIYKDDPTIMAWDIANEPVFDYFSPSVVNNWLRQVTGYIKSIDQNHLVTLGNSGWLGDAFDKNDAYYEAFNVPDLDFFSFHMYPPTGYAPPAAGRSDSYLDAIEYRTRTFLLMGKPVVLEEFGFTSYRQLVTNLGRAPNESELQQWLEVYKEQMDVTFTAGASGAMFWGWGVSDTKLVPLWWHNEDHDISEKEFCAMIKNYLIPNLVNQ